jgi:transforming growth factor-beta-induced protein
MLYSKLKKVISTLAAFTLLASAFVSPIVSAATGDIVDVATKSAPEFSTLVSALTAGDLVSALQGNGPFTVVAPTNSAFAALPPTVLSKLLLPINKPELQKILKYHLVSGNFNSTALTSLAGNNTPTAATLEGSSLKFTIVNGALKINSNTSTPQVGSVITPNVSATNGIIHVIDQVLLPSTFDPASLKDAPTVSASNNIVQTAIASKDFSTLVAAVKAAGLVDTLSGTGPFTVFAPTNDAFAKVPADVLSKLVLPENKDALVKVLTYHVVSGKYTADELVKVKQLKTVEGSSVEIDNALALYRINSKSLTNSLPTDTNVNLTNIQTSNGIIHSIDSVLIPASVDLAKLSSGKTEAMKGDHTIRTGGSSITINSLFLGLFSVVSLAFAIRAVSNKNSL